MLLLNLYDSRPTAPTFLVFFKENARCRNPATFLRFTFIVFSQVQCVLGSQVSVNSHVMLPAPAGSCFFSQGKTSKESPGSFKAGRKTYVDQGVFSCVCGKEKKWRCGKHLSKGSPSTKKKSTSKRRYVETAGSEETSSVFMLWAKTCVYICSGRAGGNERDLLFYVRYEEPWHPHPTPPNPRSYVACGCVASSHERQHPHPTPPNPRSYVACGCVASSHERQSLFLINIHPLLPPTPTEKSLCFLV